MCVYLIDYENVGIKGLNGIGQLSESDKVYIFYGKNAGSVSFDTLEQIINSPAKVNCLRALKSAKNYLDFQLVTFSGFLVANLDDKDYKIISKDTGFDAVVDFWNARQASTGGVKFSRQEAIVMPKMIEMQLSQVKKEGKQPSSNNQRHTPNRFNKHVKTQPHAFVKTEEKPQSLLQDEEKPQPLTAEQIDLSMKEEEVKETAAKQNETVKSDVQKEEAKAEFVKEEVVKEEVKKEEVRKEETEEIKEDKKAKETAHKPEVVLVKEKAVHSSQKTDGKSADGSKRSKQAEKLPESYRKKIREKVKDERLKAGTYTSIYNCVLRCESKQQLHTNLVKALKMEKGAAVYKLIVPIFEEFHKAD